MAGRAAAARALAMTGTQLQDQVWELCQLWGLKVAHFRPARTEQGWRTAVQYDGKGWPDLSIAGTRLLFREIKRDDEATTQEQDAWLVWLRAASQDADIWRPADWKSGRIRAELESIRWKGPRP